MPHFDPTIPKRRSIRLKKYDYSDPGSYFVTVNAYRHSYMFSDIRNGEVLLSDRGRIVTTCWQEIPLHFEGVTLDAFVVMPNHIHGILVIEDQGTTARRATHESPVHTAGYPNGPKSGSVGAIVGLFKSASARRINQSRDTHIPPVWHRNYYERVIRNEAELAAFRAYIATNPLRWMEGRD